MQHNLLRQHILPRCRDLLTNVEQYRAATAAWGAALRGWTANYIKSRRV